MSTTQTYHVPAAIPTVYGRTVPECLASRFFHIATGVNPYNYKRAEDASPYEKATDKWCKDSPDGLPGDQKALCRTTFVTPLRPIDLCEFISFWGSINVEAGDPVVSLYRRSVQRVDTALLKAEALRELGISVFVTAAKLNATFLIGLVTKSSGWQAEILKAVVMAFVKSGSKYGAGAVIDTPGKTFSDYLSNLKNAPKIFLPYKNRLYAEGIAELLVVVLRIGTGSNMPVALKTALKGLIKHNFEMAFLNKYLQVSYTQCVLEFSKAGFKGQMREIMKSLLTMIFTYYAMSLFLTGALGAIAGSVIAQCINHVFIDYAFMPPSTSDRDAEMKRD